MRRSINFQNVCLGLSDLKHIFKVAHKTYADLDMTVTARREIVTLRIVRGGVVSEQTFRRTGKNVHITASMRPIALHRAMFFMGRDMRRGSVTITNEKTWLSCQVGKQNSQLMLEA